MKQVPIHELKRKLSEFVAAAESGASVLITRHKRVVARLAPADAEVHVGSRFGAARLRPVLSGKTRGRYLEVIADDRRGGLETR